MVGEVDDGIFIRDGAQIEVEDVILGPDIVGGDAQLTGITLLAVGADVGEAHAVGELAALPQAVLEAGRAAVQMVRAIVYGQLILLVDQAELTPGDAVGVAARNLAHAGAILEVGGIVGIVKGDVLYFAVAVGDA